MADLFEQLLEFQWRDVSFPVTKTRLTIAHDLVEHKYPGVDGARVEDTGLAPWRITASIPAINGLAPGKNERWSKLYPDMMRALLVAFANRADGVLQHPEFGQIACKAERIEMEWTGDRRGGTQIEASWVETIEDFNDTSALAQPSPVNEVELAAIDLDADTADLRQLIPQLPEFKAKALLQQPIPTLPKYQTSFADLARGIQSIGDQVTLLSMRTSGVIDSLVYRVDNVSDSLDRAKTALTWPAKKNCALLKAAALDLKKKLLQANRDIVLYVVPGDTTIAGLLPALDGATLNDVIRLNPQLVAEPIVSKGTVIRYYVPRMQRAA